MTQKETKGSLPAIDEQELGSLEKDTLSRARGLRSADTQLGEDVGLGGSSARVFEIIKSEFAFDPTGEAAKTEERYGGLGGDMGYLDELHPTNQLGVYLKLVFNSRDGLERRAPSAMSLIRLDIAGGAEAFRKSVPTGGNAIESTDLLNQNLTPAIIAEIKSQKASADFRTIAGRPWWVSTYTAEELREAGLL